MRNWKKYFKNSLGRVERRVVIKVLRWGAKEKREQDISREEVKRVIGKLKERKAKGVNKIPIVATVKKKNGKLMEEYGR